MPEQIRVLRAAGLSVPKRNAERALIFLKSQNLLEPSLQLLRFGDRVVLPVKDATRVPGKALGELEATLTEAEFPERQKRPKSIKEALSDALPAPLLERLPSSYDIVGDIALVHVPSGLEPHAQLIGEAIMRVNKSIKVVLGEAGCVEGLYRLRRLVHLAGQNRTATLHRENGCIFQVDLARAYFSPRLSGERMRIASQVGKEEVVADMFAGVGPFSVTIAKHSGARVYAAELNRDAYELLVRNIELNKVSGLVIPLHGDCRKVFVQNKVKADRVVMNYPADPFTFLDAALEILGGGGAIHIYGFAESAGRWGEELSRRLSERGASFTVSLRVLREVSPRRKLLGADVILKD